MAITGTFSADFSSFSTAVQNADVRLKAFEASSNKVETSLSRMTNSFTGQKVITEATLMAEAIERIGGVSKLTEAELSRVSATAKEAAAKLTAMGQDVPPGIQKIADVTTGATGAAFNWKNALLGVAGTLGIAFSVNALKNFAISVIDTGAAIGDMAVKLGVSAEAIQRWKYAAEQSGTTIDVVEASIAIMNRTLAEGNKSTVQALAAAGLSFDEIRKMAPEEAFNAITDAVGKIEDPMVRAKVATVLFGRAGQDMLPAMIAGFQKVGAEVRVMSDDTIARLKAAQDAWARLSAQVTIHTGEMIAETFRLTASWKDMVIGLAVPSFLRDNVRAALGGIYDTTESLAGALAKIPPRALAMAAGLKPVAISGAEVDATITKMNASLGLSTQALGLVEPKLGTLAEFTRNLAKHTETLNTGWRFTSQVVGELPPKLDDMAASLNKVAVAQTAANASKFAPGSVGINTGGIALGNFEAAFKAYNNIYRSNSGVGAIGGGPAPDFLSWALKNGFATKTLDPAAGSALLGGSSFAGGPSANVNVSGILMGSDPSALQQMRDLVEAAVRQAMRGEGARV